MEKQIQHYLSRLLDNPSDRRPIYGLARVFGEQGDWSGFVQTLFQAAESTDSAELKALLFVHAGEAASFQLGNMDVGQNLLQRALEMNGEGGAAAWAQMRMLKARGDWDGLIALCRELQNADDAGIKAESLYWMGEAFRDRLNDPANAIKAFQAAFKTDPTLYPALQAARDIYASAGKWDMVAQLLQLEARQLQNDRDAWLLGNVLADLAEVLQLRVGDAEKATLYFQHALKCDPANPRARAGLTALGVAPPPLEEDAAEAAPAPAEEEPAAAAEPAASDEDDSVSVDVDAEEDERVEVEVEAAPAAAEEPAPAPVAAAAAEEPAVEAAEEEEEAVEVEVEAEAEVEAPAADAEEAAAADAEPAERTWEDVVEELVAGADQDEGVEAFDGYLQALRLTLENDPKHPLVTALLDKALGAEPGFDGFYASLAGRLDGGEAVWTPLYNVFAKHAEGSASVRRQMVQIKLYEMGKLDEAAAGIEALGAEAGELAQELADARVGEGGSWRRLQQELSSRFEGLGREDKAEAAYGRMAAIARGLGQGDREIDALRHMLSEAPQILWARARLKHMYAASDKWNAYIELLKEELNFYGEHEVAAKVAHLRRMVEIYRDHLKLDVMVINTYNQILELDPTNRGILEGLAEQYEAMRRYPDLIGVTQKLAELARTREERIALNLRVANLFLEKFSNQAEAIKAFEAVLELDPGHTEAIEFLKQMYERRRDWEKLIDVHIKEIDAIPAGPARGERFKEVAKLATERLRKPEVATDLWIKVLDYVPGDLDALQALEQLYERNKDWEHLADISERKLAHIDDAAEKVKLAEKLGRLYSERLEAPDKAIAAWRVVLEHDPGNRKGLDSLKRLLIDKQDWDGLESFYGSRGEDDQYVRILETLAGTVKEDEVKIDLLNRSAHVWKDKLGQTDRAVRALERILSIDANSLVAARSLVPIYEEAHDPKKLNGVLEIVLGHLNKAGERGEEIRVVLGKLARLNESELRNPGQAFAYYSQAFALSPVADLAEDGTAQLHEATFTDIERVAGSLDTWQDLVHVYQDRLDVLDGEGDDASARELRLRIGRVLNVELGRTDDALQYYDEVLNADPNELRALGAEEEIFQKTGNWSALMEIYDRKLALTDDPGERIGILLAKATILEEQNEAWDEAIEAYRAVTDIDPEHLGALQALHRLFEITHDHHALAGVIRRQIELAQAAPITGVKSVDGQGLDEIEAAGVLKPGATLAALVALKLQLGQVLATALSSEEADQEALASFTDVLAAEPGNADALALMEELGQKPELALQVADTLEPLYLEAFAWEPLVHARETQLAHLHATDIEARVGKLLSIGQILLDQVGDFERAFHAYGRALREEPGADEARDALDRISEATEDYTPYVDLLEEIVAGLADPAQQHAYTTRIALAVEQRLGDGPRAQETWRRVLELEPADEQALLHLESLYMEGQLWHELLDVYTRRLDLATERASIDPAGVEDPDQAADILEAREQLLDIRFKMAMVHEEMLSDATSAIEIYRQILDEAPDNLLAARAMDRLLGGEGRFDELAENLRRQLDLVTEPAEQRMLKCRLAGLMEAQLGQIGDAIALYAEVLREDHTNDDAQAALESLIEREPDARLQIVEVVEPLYINHGEWEKLVHVREIRIEEAQDPADRIALLHSIASIQEEQLANPHSAFGTMARALVEDVTHAESMASIYRLALETGMFAELADVLEEQAASTLDLDVAADLNIRIAQLQEDQLGDAEGATAHYRRVLELRPEHMGAIENLERIYTSVQSWAELVEIILTKVNLLSDVDAQRTLLHHAATIFEEFLSQPEQAIEAYQRVLTLDEFDATSIDALERLFLGADRWIDLIDLYGRKIRMAQTDAERKELYFAVGAVYEAELMDPDQAIATYRAVTELDPNDRGALEALDRLYQGTEQWTYLLETLEREIELNDDPETKLTLKFRVGALWETQLSDPIRAIEVYRQILADAPEHEATAQALEGMISRGEEPVLAAEVLEPIYRNGQLWSQLIAIYEILIGSSEDPLRQSELLKEVGQIYELRLGDGAMAFHSFARAMGAVADDEGVLDTLERLASEQDGWEELVRVMEDQLSNLSDYDVARRIALRIGRILEEELFDTGRAIDRYRAVLDLDPTAQEAILALDRLYEREGRWYDLAEILQQEINQAEDEDQQIALRFRLGTLYESALEDVEMAIQTYHDILLSRPEHSEALEALERMFGNGYAPMQIGEILEPIYREREQWEKLVEVYLVQLNHKELPDDRFAHLYQIAELYRTQLANPAQAFYTLGNALKERPGDVQVVEELEQLAASLDTWEDLAGIFHDALESSTDPDEQRRLWLKVAEVLDHKLSAYDQAEGAYLQVLQMDPGDEVSLGALDRIYTQASRWADLADILRREIEISFNDEQTVVLNFRLGSLYEHELGELDLAIDTYNRILEIDPNHTDALSELESIYLMREQWEPLFSVYERQAELLIENEDERVEVIARMADLADQFLFRPLDAIDLWNRVLDIRPTDLPALRALSTLYEREERHGELIGVLERQLELVDDSQKINLLARVGNLWLEHLYNEDNSLDAWKRLLELSPDNLDALYACRDLYQRLGQYEDLVQTVDNIIMLAAAEAEELKELYTQLGEVHGNLLGRSDDAIRAWQSVLELEPSNQLALNSLERLFTEQGNWEACVDILDRKVLVIEAQGESDELLQEQIELRMRIAEMWERQIGNRDLAINAYEALLEIEPGHLDASRAVEMLYLDAGEFAKLPDLYFSRREYIEDPFDRLELIHKAARIYEQNLHQPEAAFLILISGFLEAPQDEQTANELERLAGSTGQWDDLVTAYLNVLEGMEDDTERQFLHKKVAKWIADELNEPDKAIEHFNEALRINPEDTEAMADVERVYERTARWSELVRTMENRALLTPDYESRVELYRRIGDIYDLQLNNAPEAIRAYGEILLIDDADLGALESLERIYEINGAWNQLIETLQRKAAVVFEPDQVLGIKYRIAQLQESNVRDLERAVEAYRDVLSIDQTHVPSMQALERLYGQLERWHDLLDNYDLQLSLAQDGRDQIGLYWKTAQVYEQRFSDRERAVEAFGKILLVDPNHVEAIMELERLFQDLQRWIELIETYERHIEAVADKATRIDLFQAMGIVHRDYLHDVYRAIESNQRILEINPRHPDALRELAALYEMASDWESCLGSWQRLAEVVADPAQGVEIHYKMGRIYEENLAEPERAKERFRFCLELEPSYKPAMDALRTMYEREGDWPGVVLVLKQEEEYTRKLEDKAALLCLIGNTYEQALQDEVSALAYYEQAIVLNPENLNAAEPLARIYLGARQWERAEPQLQLIVQKRGYDRSDPDLYLLYHNLAACCENLGRDQLAVQNYQQAYELNPSHLDTLMGLGRLYYKANDFVRGFKILQTLAYSHGHALQPAQLVDTYYKCGEIKRQSGETRFAQQLYEKALEIDPYHVDSLARLVEMAEGIGEWEQVVEYKRRQLQRVKDGLERFTILVEIGDIFREQLPDPNQSVMAYHEALQIQPESMATLRKLLDLYTRAQMWPEAVQTIIRITTIEKDSARLATYFYTIGVISRDQLGDAAQSVDYFNRALDVDPVGMLKAFEAIDRVLTALKEWKELERSYRKMLHRIKDIPDTAELHNLKLLLWRNLGEIYRTRQGNYDAAIQAYKIASQMNPDEANYHEILADLYERSGTGTEEAIVEHKKLISMSPFRIASYRALFNAYMKLGKYDEAWCMASALTFLQSAEKEEQEFYQRYLGQNLQAAKRPLTNEHWKVLYHPEQDLLTSQIMGIIGANMRAYYAFDYKTWNLHKRKDLLDPNQQQPFCKIFLYAARTFGLNPPPRLFLKMDGSVLGVRNANLDPPALIVGADMFQGRQDRELGFALGKNVALSRPEHYLGGGFFPTANLKALFLAAMQMTNPGLNLGANEEFIRIIQEMQRLPPPILIQLQKTMQQFFQSGQNPNLSQWVTAVDHTTNRAGLLLCGDLMTAANAIKNEQASISKATPKDKIKELVVFAISDDYFKLRKELGLALGS